MLRRMYCTSEKIKNLPLISFLSFDWFLFLLGLEASELILTILFGLAYIVPVAFIEW